MQMDNTNYSESSTSPMLSPELQQNLYSSPTRTVGLTSSPINIMMYPDTQSTTPLTPAAVSPISAALYDPMAQQRKLSVDIGPFGYSSQSQSFDDYTMTESHHYHNQQQQPTTTGYNLMDPAVLIPQSRHRPQFNTAVAVPPTVQGNEQQKQLVTSSPSTATKTKQQRVSDAPAIRHKHVCKYNYCGWSFKRYEHLKRHMLVHTGERPHICHFQGCGKSFSRSDNFHAHCRTHTKKSMIQQQQPKQQRRPSSSSRGRKSSSANNSSISVTTSNVVTPIVTAVSMSANDMVSPFDYPFHAPQDPSFQQFTDHDNKMPPATMSGNVIYNDQQVNMESMYLGGSPLSTISSSSPLTGTTNNEYFMFQNNSSAQWSNIGYSPTSATMTTPVQPRRASFPVTSASVSITAQNKSHVCPVPQCQRRFKRLEHLKRHMRIHTLERPFPCIFPNCHKSFSRSDNLSQHMKTHQRHEERRKQRQQQQQHQEKQHLISTSQYQQLNTTMPKVNAVENNNNDTLIGMTDVSGLHQWDDGVGAVPL